MLDDIIQGSEEWLALKAGKWSASRASALMANGRGGAPSVTRSNLIADIVGERLTGKYTESFKSAAMDRGNELEQEAREAYSFEKGVAVDQIALICHPTIPNTVCSPDGLIGDDGLVELKCQNNARHISSLTRGTHAVEYRLQCQFQMMVSGRKWVDCVSYNPNFPADLQLAIKRVERDDDTIVELVGAIAKAEAEVAAIIEELTAIQRRNAA